MNYKVEFSDGIFNKMIQQSSHFDKTKRIKFERKSNQINNMFIFNSLFIFYLILNLALINTVYCQSTATNETSSPFDLDSTSINNPNESPQGEGGLVFTNPSLIKPNDDPENRLDIVQKARNNELNNEMITNKTRAMVSCETGEILIRLNFTEPFRGVGYANYDRSSPCKFFGEGDKYYEMRLPLRGCGTKQEAPRLFVNNIVLRFHRSLELEEDEVKTIVCRYPPPLAPGPPPPPGIPAKVINLPPEPAKLTQYEPFLIIAGLLFFALLLAGIGTTSYVTKKQLIQPINTPLPITSQTDYDTYVDNQSIISIEDLKTVQKLVPFPKLETHIVDDVFITNLHEIETEENLVYHKQILPRPQLEQYHLDDTYVTNEDEITTEDLIGQRRLALMDKKLNRLNCDDTYITNEQDLIDDEQSTHYKLMQQQQQQQPKIELRTIEDIFITNVDEVVEDENIVQKNHRQQHHSSSYQEEEDHREKSLEEYSSYRKC